MFLNVDFSCIQQGSNDRVRDPSVPLDLGFNSFGWEARGREDWWNRGPWLERVWHNTLYCLYEKYYFTWSRWCKLKISCPLRIGGLEKFVDNKYLSNKKKIALLHIWQLNHLWAKGLLVNWWMSLWRHCQTVPWISAPPEGEGPELDIWIALSSSVVQENGLRSPNGQGLGDLLLSQADSCLMKEFSNCIGGRFFLSRWITTSNW